MGKPHWAPRIFLYFAHSGKRLGSVSSPQSGLWAPLLPPQASDYPAVLHSRMHWGTRIVLLLRESGPVGPELNYCICGAWRALIHVIRRADLIRELLRGKPEKATSTQDILPPGGVIYAPGVTTCRHARVSVWVSAGLGVGDTKSTCTNVWDD